MKRRLEQLSTTYYPVTRLPNGDYARSLGVKKTIEQYIEANGMDCPNNWDDFLLRWASQNGEINMVDER